MKSLLSVVLLSKTAHHHKACRVADCADLETPSAQCTLTTTRLAGEALLVLPLPPRATIHDRSCVLEVCAATNC